MRYPKHLPENGTIGFAAPSFGCGIEPYKSGFESAQKKFRALGYRLQLGPNCYEGSGIGISNTPEKCAEELMEYYCSEENDCLISCGGGELMCEILPHMDFDKIKAAEPKWYMGYSDNTNMTYLLATLCDTAAVYGPCAAAFGMEPWHPAIEDALGVLKGTITTVRGYERWEKESLKNEENPFAPYNVTEPEKIRSFIGMEELIWEKSPEDENLLKKQGQRLEKRIEFQGRLLGGCMDCLVNLLGTRFDKTREFIEKYKEDGIIWFLEACDLNVFSIRRAMWQMEQAGWLEHTRGFLIGRPLTAYGQELMGLDAYQAVLEVAGRKGVPVIMDVDLGHLPPMMPIVVGSMGTVQVCGNEISVKLEYR